MVFAESTFPLREIDGRKIYVGFGCGGVNVCQTELVGEGEGGRIKRCSSDNEDLCFLRCGLKCFFRASKQFGARGSLREMAAYDEVPTMGKCPLRERFEGFSAHDDGVTGSQCFEALQVCPEVKEHLTVQPDCTLFVECAYECEHMVIALYRNFGTDVRIGIVAFEVKILIVEGK